MQVRVGYRRAQGSGTLRGTRATPPRTRGSGHQWCGKQILKPPSIVIVRCRTGMSRDCPLNPSNFPACQPVVSAQTLGGAKASGYMNSCGQGWSSKRRPIHLSRSKQIGCGFGDVSTNLRSNVLRGGGKETSGVDSFAAGDTGKGVWCSRARG